jgi:hypothetical protein
MSPFAALAIKVLLTAIVVVGVAELGKRSTFWAAVLASLPLTSLLAFVWMRVDGEQPERIASLSTAVFWLVLPSLLLFLLFPWLLRSGLGFTWSLLLACAATACAYAAMALVLPHFDVRL